jgi:tRNA pseudouridine38-40 synthase
VWYRGGGFRGFQAQVGGGTVQQALDQALREVGAPTDFGGVMPAGRTDRGVHARMQVVGLRASAAWAPDALAAALNARLPEGVGVARVRVAPAGFHPQWSATGKHYRYRLQLEGAPAAAWAGLCWRPSEHPRLEGARIDPGRLGALLARCEGTRDFSALHARSSVRKARTVTRAELVACGEGRYEARFGGAGFARYQVRILVGTCAAVAAGVLSEAQLGAALEAAEPIEGIRAPGEGLVLWEVDYPPLLDPFPDVRGLAEGVPSEPPFL